MDRINQFLALNYKNCLPCHKEGLDSLRFGNDCGGRLSARHKLVADMPVSLYFEWLAARSSTQQLVSSNFREIQL